MRLVLDCSVAPGFIFAEERTDYTEAVESTLERRGQWLVPPLFYCEFTNLLRTQERRGRWDSKETEACLHVFCRLPLLTIPIALSSAEMLPLLALARDYELTAYDATYLWLARREQIPLATQDKALIRAARASGCYFEG